MIHIRSEKLSRGHRPAEGRAEIHVLRNTYYPGVDRGASGVGVNTGEDQSSRIALRQGTSTGDTPPYVSTFEPVTSNILP